MAALVSSDGNGSNGVTGGSHNSSLTSEPQLNESAPVINFTFRSRRFKRMNSIWLTALLMLFYVVFLALVLPLHWYCSNKHCVQSAFSIVIYSNAGLWFVTVVVAFLVHLDFESVRRRGYADFYKKNHFFVKDPFVVFSLGNAALLVYTWILYDTGALARSNSLASAGVRDNETDETVYFIGFQIIVAIEVVVGFIFLVVLTARIVKFNGLAQPPDVMNDTILSRSNEPTSVVGYSESVNDRDLVIDKQFERMNFLKRRCRLLYGSLRKLLASFPSEQRKRHEEILRQYLEDHHDDDYEDGVDINEYLGAGALPPNRDDDVPLITP